MRGEGDSEPRERNEKKRRRNSDDEERAGAPGGEGQPRISPLAGQGFFFPSGLGTPNFP